MRSRLAQNRRSTGMNRNGTARQALRLAAAALLALATAAAGTTRYVDAVNGHDDCDGLDRVRNGARGPTATIQAAIDRAADGDTVILACATYREALDFRGKAITVRSAQPADSACVAATRILAPDADEIPAPAVSFLRGEPPQACLDGVTVACPRARAIAIEGASPTLRRCHIRDSGTGVAIFAPLDSATGLFRDTRPRLEHCLLTDNQRGLTASFAGFQLDFVTIARNGCGIAANGAPAGPCHAAITHAIFWENGSPETPADLRLFGTATVDLSWSCHDPDAASVEAPAQLRCGDGTLLANPLFADPANGDFHLRSLAGRWQPTAGSWHCDPQHSPCIDAGNPETPCDLETAPHGSRPNLGAYGATPEASRSLPETPLIRLSTEAVTVPEDGQAEIAVRLSAPPAAPVTVTAAFTETSDDSLIVLEPVALLFTATTWDRPQTVTIAARPDDDARNGRGTLRLRGSDPAMPERALAVAEHDDEVRLTILAGPGGSVLPDGEVACAPWSTVSLQAIPEPGRVFAAWTGDTAALDNPANATTTALATATATFTATFTTPPDVSYVDATTGDDDADGLTPEVDHAHGHGPRRSIAAAIAAAPHGATIVVAPGTYPGGIVFPDNRALTLRSIAPDNTAVVAATCIDAAAAMPPGDLPGDAWTMPLVTVPPGCPDGSALEGLTLRAGTAGAIRAHGASPAIRHCRIRSAAEPTTPDPHGTAPLLWARQSRGLVVEDCDIGPANATGLLIQDSAGVILRRNTIHDCGAITPGNAGGIALENCSAVTIDQCHVLHCHAAESAISLTAVTGTLRHAVIARNRAVWSTPGLQANACDLVVDHVTIVGNRFTPDDMFGSDAATALAAGACFVQGAVQLRNSILRDNRVEDSAGQALPAVQARVSMAPAATLAYINVTHGRQGLDVGTLCPIGITDTDPLFADPDHDDLHLRSTCGRWSPATGQWIADTASSPCIDAADPDAAFDHEPAGHGGRANLGAYGNTPEASRSAIAVPEGGTTNLTVALVTPGMDPPTADAVIRIERPPETAVSVTVTLADPSGRLWTSTRTLTFTPDAWQTPLAVTLHAADDDDATPDSARLELVLAGQTEPCLVIPLAQTENECALTVLQPESGGALFPPGTSLHPVGTRLRLTAVANAGGAFAEWTGDTGAIAQPLSDRTVLTLTTSTTLSGRFLDYPLVAMPDRACRPGRPLAVWARFTIDPTLGTPDYVVWSFHDLENLLPVPDLYPRTTWSCLEVRPVFTLVDLRRDGHARATVTAVMPSGASFTDTVAITVVDCPDQPSLEHLDTQRQIAIADALRWLYGAQNPDGSWDCGASDDRDGEHDYVLAATASALWAFANAGHSPAEPGSDPYQTTMQAAIDYILDQSRYRDIAPSHGLDPDADGDGRGILLGGLSDSEIRLDGYARPLCLAALCATGTPLRRTRRGPCAAFTQGQTYLEIAQDSSDMLCAILAANRHCGWRYRWDEDSSADMSIASWNCLALEAAMQFGARVPEWAGDRVARLAASTFLNTDDDRDGRFGYAFAEPGPDSPGGPSADSDATSAGGLGALALASSGPRLPAPWCPPWSAAAVDPPEMLLRALRFWSHHLPGDTLVHRLEMPGETPPPDQPPQTTPELYGLWTAARALRLLGVTHLNHPTCGPVDWQRHVWQPDAPSEGIWPLLLRSQDEDGTWAPAAQRAPGRALATAWGVLCLCETVIGRQAYLSDVAITSVLPADPQLVVLPESCTRAPAVVADDRQRLLLWNLGSLAIGDEVDLSYDQYLCDPQAGTERTIQTDLIAAWRSSGSRLTEVALGPLTVAVDQAGVGLSLDTAKAEAAIPDLVRFSSTVRLPPGQAALQLARPTAGSHILHAPGDIACTWLSLHWALSNAADFPAGAAPVALRCRSAATTGALPGVAFSAPLTTPGAAIPCPPGRVLELAIDLHPVNGVRPVLGAVTVYGHQHPARVVVEAFAPDERCLGTVAAYDLLSSDYGTTTTRQHRWNTANASPGTCRLRAVLREADQPRAKAEAAVTLRKPADTGAVTGTIRLDDAAYGPRETVALTCLTQNQTAAFAVTETAVTVLITGPDGATPPGGSFAYRPGRMEPGTTHTARLTWDTGLAPPGTYTVTQHIEGGHGLPATTAATCFEILPGSAVASAVAGTLQVEPARLTAGEPLHIAWGLENTGNSDLHDVTVRLRVLAATAAAEATPAPPLASHSEALAVLPLNPPRHDDAWDDAATGSWPPGDCLVVLEAGLEEPLQALAVERLEVIARDTTPPQGWITYGAASEHGRSVVATLCTDEPVTITSNQGAPQITFTANGTFLFTFVDHAGNPGSALAEVTWIEPDTAVTDAVIIATGTAQVLTIAGGRNRIDGGIHSNDEVHIAAGQTRVNGRVSAHGNVRFTGPKVWAGAVAPRAGIVTLPTFSFEEFRRRADVTYPDSQRFDGDLPDGLHVVDGDVTLTGNLSARVTIVASGDILLAAGQRRLQAWDRTGILFLAGGDIRVSGSTNHFTGTLHAPDGCFSTAGCRNAFLDSRIWAREVAIIGGWNDFGQARQEDPATTRPRPATASRQRPRQASHREDSAP